MHEKAKYNMLIGVLIGHGNRLHVEIDTTTLHSSTIEGPLIYLGKRKNKNRLYIDCSIVPYMWQ
jgi:hypothetical protein